MKEFPNVCRGIGLVKDRQVSLKIDPNVKPIAQPLRRIPFALRGKLETKLNQMLKDDLIEPVEEATGWVSNLVIVPKERKDTDTEKPKSETHMRTGEKPKSETHMRAAEKPKTEKHMKSEHTGEKPKSGEKPSEWSMYDG